MLRSMTLALSLLISCASFAQTPIYSSQYNGGDVRLNDKALATCRGMFSSSISNQCLAIVQSARFSNRAVESCNSMWSENDTLNCLRNIANKAYQSEALTTCNTMFSSQLKLQCLNIVANKYYDTRLLDICKAKWSENDTVSCLQSLRYERMVDYSSTNYGTPGDGSIDLSIVIDLGGGITIGGTINIPNTNTAPCYNCHDEYTYNHEREVPRRQQARFCTVRETTAGGRSGIAMASASDFYQWVNNQSNTENRCAVAHLGQTDRSTRVYNNGRRMDNGNGLTYKEATEIKRSFNLRGCADFICE